MSIGHSFGMVFKFLSHVWFFYDHVKIFVKTENHCPCMCYGLIEKHIGLFVHEMCFINEVCLEKLHK